MGPIERIAGLRKLMRDHFIDALLVPSADPHQSEYVAERWQTRAWLSGFTGSAGTVVVTQEKCGLWTDSRYHIRAAHELAGSEIELFRTGLPGVPSYAAWLQQELREGDTLGFDGSVLSVSQVAKLDQAFRGKAVTFSYQNDLVGQLWHDRPKVPQNPISLHDMKYAGESRRSKIRRIRDKLKEQGVHAQLVTTLDDIAWTLNIRGSDVQYNPVAISYAVISEWEVRLFIRRNKVPNDVRQALEKDGVQFSEYEDVFSFWHQVPDGTTVLVDPEKTSHQIERILSQTCRVKKGVSIPYSLKATKNETELEGVRKAHIRDGVSLVKWMCWLDQQSADIVHTEITVARRLAEFRGLGEHSRGLSFGTIAGYQANSAIGHYNPRSETTPKIGPEGILLVDSGGQYLDGTTDVTRTITLGSPTREEKQALTLVLKGLIKVSRAKFPKGTTGSALDALAREPLWQHGYNCRHGTGHGIGSYLNVHEGPQRLSSSSDVSLGKGMVTTIEPGVYFEGKFGVRLENVLITVAETTTGFGDFYSFETVTLCPIDLDLVETSLLDSEERTWLNEYHRLVNATLTPFLSQAEQAWLRHETREI